MATTSIDKDRYYFKNGSLYACSDRHVTSILIASKADLQSDELKKLEPGSIAHTPGYVEEYELSPTYTWVKVTRSTGGGSSGGGEVPSDGSIVIGPDDTVEVGGLTADERMELEDPEPQENNNDNQNNQEPQENNNDNQNNQEPQENP